MAIYGTLGEVDLGALDASIADTAVDIFVYDTSKDSDGGAWRKRTQSTSWYNETLNTATRGGRREFPAVAVLVLESGKLTIYDGDDPDLPMWMVFNRPTINIATVLWAWSNVVPTGIVALNGIISFATTGSSRFRTLNFISEVNYTWDIGQSYINFTPISNRDNSISGYMPVSGSVASREYNDVAMTVLPSAPIDDATGLPIPTIAVATDGGVSVIRDDGQVFDVGTNGSPASPSVAIDSNNSLYMVRLDGSVYVWDDISKISADGTSQDSTITNLLGSITQLEAA